MKVKHISGENQLLNRRCAMFPLHLTIYFFRCLLNKLSLNALAFQSLLRAALLGKSGSLSIENPSDSSRQAEPPKKETTSVGPQVKRADEWKDPWRRSKSPKKKLGVSVSPNRARRRRKTSASSASASNSSRYKDRWLGDIHWLPVCCVRECVCLCACVVTAQGRVSGLLGRTNTKVLW